jgi:hypothetical protein
MLLSDRILNYISDNPGSLPGPIAANTGTTYCAATVYLSKMKREGRATYYRKGGGWYATGAAPAKAPKKRRGRTKTAILLARRDAMIAELASRVADLERQLGTLAGTLALAQPGPKRPGLLARVFNGHA